MSTKRGWGSWGPEYQVFFIPSKDSMWNKENSGPPQVQMQVEGTAGNRSISTFGRRTYGNSKEQVVDQYEIG